MYAVFRAGGKQYRASKGERLKVEKLDADEGATVTFDEVLLVGSGGDVEVGNPLVSGGSVAARVLKQARGRKIGVTKFRRRQNYLRQHTHRQWYTEVEITDIAGASAAKTEPEGSASAKSGTASRSTGKKTAKKKAAKKSAAPRGEAADTTQDKAAGKAQDKTAGKASD